MLMGRSVNSDLINENYKPLKADWDAICEQVISQTVDSALQANTAENPPAKATAKATAGTKIQEKSTLISNHDETSFEFNNALSLDEGSNGFIGEK